jgi:competence protein CoiA
MIWALDLWKNERVEAWPEGRANCPLCKSETIAKCGEIKVWHWAHKSVIDCDPWWEPESQWHLDWKKQFPIAWQEVIVGPHRADVKTPTGTVIEFQASSISTEKICEREAFYGSMKWVLRGEDFADFFDVRESSRYAKLRCKRCGLKQGWPMAESAAFIHGNSCPDCGGDLEPIPKDEYGQRYWTFRWKHPRKSWSVATKPLGIDFEGMIFWIQRLYDTEQCAGWGTYQRHADFVLDLVNEAARRERPRLKK